MVLPNVQGSHIWDGKKIVQEKTDFKAMHPDLPPQSERRSGWMSYLSVAFAVIGTLAFAIYFFRSRRRNA
jgi:hypothetical protein